MTAPAGHRLTTSLGITAGLAVVGAGAARVGPLETLGWTDQRLAPAEVPPPASRQRLTPLRIGFDRNLPDSCYHEFRVSLAERPDQVVVKAVIGRVPRFDLLARNCARRDARGHRGYVQVRLTDPLQDRAVVSGAGRTLLPAR
jgi:hypothetical protein